MSQLLMRLTEEARRRTEPPTGDDEVAHVYRRPPVGPGSVAYCGHLWTPEEAERSFHGIELPRCERCELVRHG